MNIIQKHWLNSHSHDSNQYQFQQNHHGYNRTKSQSSAPNLPSCHDKAIGMVDINENQDMPHENIEIFISFKIGLSEIHKTDGNM